VRRRRGYKRNPNHTARPAARQGAARFP